MSRLLRLAGALGAVAVVTAAHGQDLTSASSAIRAIRDNNGLGNPLPNPLQPTGFPSPPEKVPNLKDEEGQTSGYQLIHTDEQRVEGNVITLSGDVEFLAQGYRVQCDKAIGNRITQIFTLSGHVRIDGELFTVVEGRQVTIDFINKTYEALDSESQLSPRLLQGHLKDKLYVKGHDSYGTEHETTTLDGRMTTCNYPAPHYEIDGASIVIRPGRRAIFRKTRIKVLGHTIITLPFLSIPLNNRTYKNLPYVGQSPVEGDFIKMRYGIPTKNAEYNVDTREEYMTKLGLGLGTDYEYANTRSAGTFSIYHIFGRSDDLTISNTHKQVFRWGSLTLQDDYEKDNYLVNPSGSTFNTRVGLVLPQGQRGSDRINFTDAISSSFGTSTTTETLAIDDQRSFGSKTQTTFDVNYYNSSSQYASSASTITNNSNERMDVHLQAQQDLNAAQAMLEYQRSVPIGHTMTSIGGSDETPVLSLNSDARRLFGNQVGQELPFKTTLSWGDFQNPQTNSPVSRGYFDFSFARTDPSKTHLHIDLNGDFHQGIYSDGAAEYVTALGTNMRYDLGGTTGINLRYNYSEPFGYSPLSLDQSGKTDFVSSDLNFKPFRPLLVGAQTGFDFLRQSEGQIGWQQIGLRTEYDPAHWFMLRGLYTYDTFEQSWSTLQFDLTYLPGATKIAIGSTFQGEQHTWSAVNFYMDNLKCGRMKIASALSYNGFLKTFDSEQVSVIYDLHCAEAVFELQQNNTGFQSGRQIQFFLRLKALPYDVPFGVGTRGQPIGVNTTGTILGG